MITNIQCMSYMLFIILRTMLCVLRALRDARCVLRTARCVSPPTTRLYSPLYSPMPLSLQQPAPSHSSPHPIYKQDDDGQQQQTNKQQQCSSFIAEGMSLHFLLFSLFFLWYPRTCFASLHVYAIVLTPFSLLSSPMRCPFSH